MITIKALIIILFIHWIADFWAQTDWEAKNKSSNNKALLQHTSKYSLYWFLGAILLDFSLVEAFLFAVITFVAHTLTDYFTSRLNKRLWEEGNTHWFFIAIGGDQILHYLQLILTYYLLK